MEQHLIDKHEFTAPQLPVLLDICERPADLEEMNDCPLCLERLTLSSLQSHLASHLEDLALFVLPVDIDDQSKNSSSDKVEPHQHELSQHDIDDLSSLGTFSGVESDNAPLVQDEREFARLFEKDESLLPDSVQGWLKTGVSGPNESDEGYPNQGMQAAAQFNSTQQQPAQQQHTASQRSVAQTTSYWSVTETQEFPKLLAHFGTDWQEIANHMTSKTHIMVRP
jgi:hypothetical protein